MNVNEYQAKSILMENGVAIPDGRVARTAEEAAHAFHSLGAEQCVVKAQIAAGGRGKSGGIKFAQTADEAAKAADTILGSVIVNRQTGQSGMRVNMVLVEAAMVVAKEFYLAFVIDRTLEAPAIVVSAKGGTEVETSAADLPEEITKECVDPAFGIHKYQLRRIAAVLGLDGELYEKLSRLIDGLFAIFVKNDCVLLEVNPLALTADGTLCALDAKMVIDDNALFRWRGVIEPDDTNSCGTLEAKASANGLSYVRLDGDVGCMVNGAGLAMATMDIIKMSGAAPANFLDVGGDATIQKVKTAFELILADKNVKAVLINIFGGIVKCDIVASAIVEAVNAVGIDVPLVVRLEGTNEQTARDILGMNTGLNIISAMGMGDAADKIVLALKGRNGYGHTAW